MAKVYLKKLLESNLPLTDDDFTMSFTNEGNLYITKQDGTQLKISDLITGYNNLLDLQTQNPRLVNKLYLTKDYKLYIYNGSDYISLNSNGELDTEILNLLLELESKTDTFGYDSKDNVTSMNRVYDNVDLDDENTVYMYDNNDNIIEEKITKMGKVVTNTFSYDNSGNVIEVKTTVVDM